MGLMDCNIQELMNLVKANENSKDFDLSNFKSPCGTYGCLVGNHALDRGTKIISSFNKEFRREYVQPCDSLNTTNIYNLTFVPYWFLFSSIEKNSCGKAKRDVYGSRVYRDASDKEAAMNRVRKLIYYVLRKRELMPDRSTKEGRESYDISRNSGDIGVQQQVLQTI